MLIDTHCHLDAGEFANTAFEHICQAQAFGVRALVIPAVAPANFSVVADLARQLSHRSSTNCAFMVAYTLGIHPLYTPQVSEHDMLLLRQAIESALTDPLFVGIGEIGLDFFVRGLDHAKQFWFYQAQLKLAQEFTLPVLLHVRRAQDQVLKALRRYRVRGIAHAFNGSQQQAEQFIKLGFKLGFGGAMTYPRALQIRRLATHLPLDCLVLETDAPDLPPAWLHTSAAHRPLNSPRELAQIAACLAQLRGLALAELVPQTGRNALVALPRLASLLS